jgi:hypothetical protein
MLNEEAANTNLFIFALIQPGLEPIIYCTQGEQADHYITDVVKTCFKESNHVSKLNFF